MNFQGYGYSHQYELKITHNTAHCTLHLHNEAQSIFPQTFYKPDVSHFQFQVITFYDSRFVEHNVCNKDNTVEGQGPDICGHNCRHTCNIFAIGLTMQN